MSKRAIKRQAEADAQRAAELAVKAAEEETQRKRVLSEAEKFMRLDDASMHKAFAVYRQALKSIGDTATANEARAWVEKIIQAWGTWDATKLTAYQQDILNHQYTVNLPKHLKEAAVDEHKHHHAVDRKAWQRLHSTYNHILGVIVDNATPVQPLPLSEANVSTTAFPPLSQINADVENRLQTLATMWQQAQQQVTTVEDRFFIEQIAKSYLPDMWRMYQPFGTADPKTQQQAAKLVLDQIDLLRQGVQRILDSTRDVSLGELKAHKTFLTKRLSQSEQRLELANP